MKTRRTGIRPTTAFALAGALALAGSLPAWADDVVGAAEPVVVSDDIHDRTTTVVSASSESEPSGGSDASPGGNDDNRSGLGDGTNPGQGDGRSNSPNEGTDNPNQAPGR